MACELLKKHHSLIITKGSFTDEYEEQLMAVMFINPYSKVLEIGGNIGRNSLIIGSIVDNKNFVVLESDKNNADILRYNRDINKMSFTIINKCLSRRNLIQKGWNTIPSDVLYPGYVSVDKITWKKLNELNSVDFDTLVLDCEGAIYYILLDEPDLLDRIDTIIIENDFLNINHERYIHSRFTAENFSVVYEKGITNKKWMNKTNFYQVWKRHHRRAR